MRRAWMILAALAACGKPSPKGSVVLFMGTDEGGAHRIFEQPPGFEPTSVAALDNVQVRTAVVSPGGTAIAVHTTEGTIGVLRPDGRYDHLFAKENIARVVAVDDAARTVVGVTAKNDLVIAGERTEVIHPAGMLVYGIALSGDGRHLAWSTMDASCGGNATGMQTCPVTLWGVNLVASVYEPRKLVDEGAVVAYDPEFLGADGESVLYLTNLGDTSPRCVASVRNCVYQLRRIGFDGGASQQVVDDAIIGRAFPDGAIVYRRLAGARGEDRQWVSPAVMLAEPGKPPTELVAQAPLQVQQPSPDGQYIAVVRDDKAKPIAVIDRKGTEKAAIAGEVQLLGWAPHELQRGKHTLAKPKPTRMQEAADAEARRNGGNVIAANDFCRDSTRGARGKTVISFGDVLVVRDTGPRDPLRRIVDAHFSMAGGGSLYLVEVGMPAQVSTGEVFLVTLHYRVDSPPGYGWKVFAHFDTASDRFLGDHLFGGCGQIPRDETELYDTFAVEAGGSPGLREVYVGWFKPDGTRARADRTKDDRVLIGTVDVR